MQKSTQSKSTNDAEAHIYYRISDVLCTSILHMLKMGHILIELYTTGKPKPFHYNC